MKGSTKPKRGAKSAPVASADTATAEFLRREIACLTDAENNCRERAAMSWSDVARARWNRVAEVNAAHRLEREKRLAALMG